MTKKDETDQNLIPDGKSQAGTLGEQIQGSGEVLQQVSGNEADQNQAGNPAPEPETPELENDNPQTENKTDSSLKPEPATAASPEKNNQQPAPDNRQPVSTGN